VPATNGVPPLTDAEKDFVDSYLAVVDLLARLNPASSGEHTYSLLRGAQDLAAAARQLRAATERMWERGEREVFRPTLVRALRALDGERRTARLLLPPAENDGSS
jgi:hypothetical protein